jgi:pyruvate dehydrogenase E2 component (dihydrolipoamide acetyltransferase)
MITTDDVARAAAAKGQAQAAPAGAIRKPLSKGRKAMAENLAYSKSTVPHFYMRATIDATAFEAFYSAHKSVCTINDIIILACGRAMKEFGEFRSRYEGGEVVEFASANIGIAVASDAGLVVPVVEGVDDMKLEALATKSRQAVEGARAGKVSGVGRGTFTVSNLGMFGVEEFAAIINPPESAILAVGAIRNAAVVTGNQVRPGRVFEIVLSSDHRVVDGVAAAKFIAKIKGLLESPESL